MRKSPKTNFLPFFNIDFITDNDQENFTASFTSNIIDPFSKVTEGAFA